jgi:hypothetical protein
VPAWRTWPASGTSGRSPGFDMMLTILVGLIFAGGRFARPDGQRGGSSLSPALTWAR